MTAELRRLPPRVIYLSVALLLLLLLCAALAICLAGSPRPPRLTLPRIEPSEMAAQMGEDKIMAVDAAPLGPFTVEISDEEATSLLALRLPGSPFLDPQVHFTGGKMYIAGQVSLGVPLRVVSMWSATTEGDRARIHLERAVIGPFALPSVLLSSVSQTVNEMIDESGTGIMPRSIRIEEGRVTIQGTKSPPSIP